MYFVLRLLPNDHNCVDIGARDPAIIYKSKLRHKRVFFNLRQSRNYGESYLHHITGLCNNSTRDYCVKHKIGKPLKMG